MEISEEQLLKFLKLPSWEYLDDRIVKELRKIDRWGWFINSYATETVAYCSGISKFLAQWRLKELLGRGKVRLVTCRHSPFWRAEVEITQKERKRLQSIPNWNVLDTKILETLVWAKATPDEDSLPANTICFAYGISMSETLWSLRKLVRRRKAKRMATKRTSFWKLVEGGE